MVRSEGKGPQVSRCPFCGWPDDRPFRELSRHRTDGGETVWTRCACGSLRVLLVTTAAGCVAARSRPVADVL
ncbi:MAG: hypothetical protein GEU93_08785, partial [Propionibacteriales bacterium]|nr:hypothetical protein [Propionibacteriales bacterium]